MTIGRFTLQPTHALFMFLRVFDDSDLDGAPIVQWAPVDFGNSIEFVVEEAGSSGVLLRDFSSNKFLTVFGRSREDFAPIILADREGDNQRFLTIPEDAFATGDIENVRLIAAHSGKALDVFEASTIRGAPIVQFEPHDGPNQRFRFSQRG